MRSTDFLRSRAGEPLLTTPTSNKCIESMHPKQITYRSLNMKKKNLTVSGYYFDGKDSYTIHEDEHGNSTMEKQAAKVQQGYRDNAAFKLKQIKENENNGHQ